MRFTGEQKHDRPGGIVDDLRQPRTISQQQRRPLVGGEAARESNDEYVRPQRVEVARHMAELRRTQALAGVLSLQPIAHAGEHAGLHRLRDGPIACVGYMLQRFPELGIAQPFAPVATQLAIEEIRPALVQKRRHVHAVRHEAHRVVIGPDLRPLVGAQPRRDDAVNAAHPVRMSRAVKGEACHVEHARRRRRARELEEALDRQAELTDEIA